VQHKDFPPFFAPAVFFSNLSSRSPSSFFLTPTSLRILDGFPGRSPYFPSRFLAEQFHVQRRSGPLLGSRPKWNTRPGILQHSLSDLTFSRSPNIYDFDPSRRSRTKSLLSLRSPYFYLLCGAESYLRSKRTITDPPTRSLIWIAAFFPFLTLLPRLLPLRPDDPAKLPNAALSNPPSLVVLCERHL